MSIPLINKSQRQNETEVLHSIPCKFTNSDVRRNVKVDEYFETSIRTQDKALTASLRGRPINGVKINVPEGYKGIIVNEHTKRFTEECEREFHVTKTFNGFTYWNLDKEPSGNDKLMQTLDWVELAKLVHRPIAQENKLDSS